MKLEDLDTLNSPTLIIGPNRSGKTTLLDCIAYAIIGEFPSRSDASLFNRVTSGETKGRVVLEFEHKGSDYRIERELENKNRTQRARIFRDEELIAGPGVIQVNKFIAENIVRPDIFLVTNFAAQFRKVDFTNRDPAEQKRILSEMLGLRFGEYLQLFNNNKKEIEKRLSYLNGALKNLQTHIDVDMLDVLDVGNSIKHEEGRKSDFEQQINTLTQKYNDLDIQVKTFESACQSIKHKQKLLAIARKIEKVMHCSIGEVEAGYQACLQRKQEHDKGKNELDKHINGVLLELEGLRGKIQDATKKVGILQQIPCGTQFPGCMFITDSFAAQEALPELKKKYDSLTTYLSQGQQKQKETDKQTIVLDKELEGWRSAATAINQNSDLLIIMEQASEIEAMVLPDSESLQDQRDEIKVHIGELSQNLSAINQNLNNLHQTKGKLSALMEQEAERKKNIEKIREELSIVEEKMELYEMITLAFGTKGIQPLVLEIFLPDICDIANNLLQYVTGGDISITMDTLKDNISGGTRETLDINMVFSDGRVAGIEEGSGAEQLLVSSAIRAAFCAFNINRGVGLPVFIGDELFGNFDSGNAIKAMDMYHALKEYIPQIFLVSHSAETFNRTGTIIHIDNGKASITT